MICVRANSLALLLVSGLELLRLGLGPRYFQGFELASISVSYSRGRLSPPTDTAFLLSAVTSQQSER